MTTWIIFFVFAFSSPLIAKLENHFKKITDKFGNHQIENIDFIYMINLDKRPEKLAKSLHQLEPYEIYPYRFSAVNGWELSLETINDVGYHFNPGEGDGIMANWYPLNEGGKHYHEKMHVPGRTYFCHKTARGPIGISLSHLSILQDAYDSGYETIWIMEDDIKILQNPHLVSTMVEKLDNLIGRSNWDILFTDQDTKEQHGNYVPCYSCAWRPYHHKHNNFSKRSQVSKYFRKIGARYGAYSYVIQRSGIEKILFFLKERGLFLPYDMEFILPKGINLYCVTKDIVSTFPGSPSDNGSPNYLKKSKN